MKPPAPERPVRSRLSRRDRHRPESRPAPAPPPHESHRVRIETALYGVMIAGLVLAFSSSLQIQFTLPKLVILRAIGPLLIIVWMFRWRTGETRRLPAVVLIATVALGIWWVITTFLAVDRTTALNGAHGRFNGL